jgi:hypothetical protein
MDLLTTDMPLTFLNKNGFYVGVMQIKF